MPIEQCLFPDFAIPTVTFSKHIKEKVSEMIGNRGTGILENCAGIKHAFCGSNYMLVGVSQSLSDTNSAHQTRTGMCLISIIIITLTTWHTRNYYERRSARSFEWVSDGGRATTAKK